VRASNKKQAHPKNRGISADTPSLERRSGCGLHPRGASDGSQAASAEGRLGQAGGRRDATRKPLS
jgi:hypothetical protein